MCRAAAVALGQPRAMVPDDIPRLSALPLHEREGITVSPAIEGTPPMHTCCSFLRGTLDRTKKKKKKCIPSAQRFFFLSRLLPTCDTNHVDELLFVFNTQTNTPE